MRLALDRSARVLDRGRVLVAGSPLTVFRLGPAGRSAVAAIIRGEEPPATAAPLLDRLLDTGAAHPRPTEGRFTPADVTVVVPVRDHDPAATVAHLGPAAAVVVVDDGSRHPVTVSGATVVRHDASQGPAAARTTGRRSSTTPLIAFVDADCIPQPRWLAALLAHFDDDRVGLVAPRVRSEPGPGAIARYETTRSPLDLGPIEGRIAPGTRIAYVPAAAIVVRADALDAVGGFDRTLAVGEDVDLVWRLAAAGWRARYEPRAVVSHRPRPTVAALARQRARYGRSAAALDRRHPGLVAPVAPGPWAAAGWGAVATGRPLAGVLLALGPAVTLRRALPPMPERARLAVALAALGFVRVGEQVASAVTRVWWPAAVVLALARRRARAPLLAVVVVPVALGWIRTRTASPASRLGPMRYAALRLIDDAAYGAGVWAGAVRERRLGPLLPRSPRRHTGLSGVRGQPGPIPPRPPVAGRR